MPTANTAARANLNFFSIAILCQAIGFGATMAYRELVVRFLLPAPSLSSSWGVFTLVLIHSLTAYLAARIIRLPKVWQLFNLLIAPAAIGYPYLNLPQGVLLALMVLTVLMYLPTIWTRVPYYPTHKETYQKILSFIPPTTSTRFLDIGSGFGGLLFFLAQQRPQAVIEGVEISPLPLIVSRLRLLLCRSKRISIFAKSFWNRSLEGYDIVYAFLSPAPMERVWEKVRAEMKPGSIFLSNSFAAPIKADQELPLSDGRDGILYVYKL